jgi:hypothetical protein
MDWTWRLPWLTEEFKSPLPATEVLARVQRATARPPHRRDIYPQLQPEFFWGKVFIDGFELVRAFPKRNADELNISGVVEAAHNQHTCRVHIRFRLRALEFWIIWLVIALSWLLKAGGAFGGPTSGALIIPFVALSFSGLLLPIGFGSEQAKSESCLINLLELKSVG